MSTLPDIVSIMDGRIRELQAEVERLKEENARVHKMPCQRCELAEGWLRASRDAGVLARVVRCLPDDERDRVMREAADILDAKESE